MCTCSFIATHTRLTLRSRTVSFSPYGPTGRSVFLVTPPHAHYAAPTPLHPDSAERRANNYYYSPTFVTVQCSCSELRTPQSLPDRTTRVLFSNGPAAVRLFFNLSATLRISQYCAVPPQQQPQQCPRARRNGSRDQNTSLEACQRHRCKSTRNVVGGSRAVRKKRYSRTVHSTPFVRFFFIIRRPFGRTDDVYGAPCRTSTRPSHTPAVHNSVSPRVPVLDFHVLRFFFPRSFGQVDGSERHSLIISSSFPRPRGVTPFI